MQKLRLVDGILIACAFATLALTVLRSRGTAEPRERSNLPSRIENWRDFSDSTRRTGRPDAPVQIVVFSDYLCPFCKSLWHSLDSLRVVEPTGFALTYRHFPLVRIHPQSRLASQFAECARLQGRFASADSALFLNTDAVQVGNWDALRTLAHLPDTSKHKECMGSPEMSALIDRDIEDARRMGVTGTPEFLMNDRFLSGAVGTSALLEMIKELSR